MKIAIPTFVALGYFTTGLAQSLAPSPSNSVGCEPHGDHWHCDGPASATAATATSITSAAAISATGTCEPQGDHWHCPSGVAEPATPPAASATTTGAAQTTAHTDAAGTGSLPPSPVQSVGCQPHGDHWHCAGPASSTAVAGVASGTLTSVATTPATATTPTSSGAGTRSSSASIVTASVAMAAGNMAAGVMAPLVGLMGAFLLA